MSRSPVAPSSPAPTTGTSTRSTRGAAGLRWTAGGGRLGGLYATPSVAHGRIVVGSTNRRVYAFSIASGDQLWSVRAGSYVYSAAALAGATAYVGSYDHRLYALWQATGRTRWTFDAGAPISGAPTVVDGLVYFSTCGSCSSEESNPRARRTFAVDAATGRLVWRFFPDGEYSPVIADRERLYLTGFTSLYWLALQTGANLEVERHGPGGPAGLQNRCRSTGESLVPPCATSLRGRPLASSVSGAVHASPASHGSGAVGLPAGEARLQAANRGAPSLR